MEQFRKGDFIRLKNKEQHQIDWYFDERVNIFQILVIDSDFVVLNNCKESIHKSDIEPISMNGKDDFQIYCVHENIMATYVENNDSAPISKTDYTYYGEALKSCTDWDKRNYHDLITDQSFQYVHEVQHFLVDQNSGIKLVMPIF